MKTFTFGMLFVCNVFLVSSVFAQNSGNPWTFGVKAGMNLSNTTTDDYDPKVGFNIGGTVEYNLGHNFFLGSGLEFTTKGAKASMNYTDLDFVDGKYTGRIKNSLNLMYLQLPLTVGYRLPVSDNLNITFRAGGYVAYGLTIRGKCKYNGIVTEPDGEKRDWNFEIKYKSFDYANIKRFDFGLLGSVGVEFNKFSVNLGYEYGLRNLEGMPLENNPSYGQSGGYNSLDYNKSSKWKNMNATLSVGYKF